MNKLKLLVAISVAAAAMFASPMYAQAAATTQIIPFDTDINLCNGDPLHLSGSQLVLSQVTGNATGGFTVVSQFDPQGVIGIDPVTGTTYHFTGTVRDTYTLKSAGAYTNTFIDRFHVQATSGEDTFFVYDTFHMTITPDGNLTAFVSNISVSCPNY
jgi:hypothetical protein